MFPDIMLVVATVLLGVSAGGAIMSRGKNIGWLVATANAALLVGILYGWI